ncbi:MAG: hypothetical protein AB1352_02150 [Patescibacteria group bacterium]
MGFIAYVNIPVSTATKAEIAVQNVAAASALVVDTDGDGTVDFTVDQDQAADPITQLQILKKVVQSLHYPSKVEKSITIPINAAIRLLERGQVALADTVLQTLITHLHALANQHFITPQDAANLIQTIEQVRSLL